MNAGRELVEELVVAEPEVTERAIRSMGERELRRLAAGTNTRSH